MITLAALIQKCWTISGFTPTVSCSCHSSVKRFLDGQLSPSSVLGSSVALSLTHRSYASLYGDLCSNRWEEEIIWNFGGGQFLMGQAWKWGLFWSTFHQTDFSLMTMPTSNYMLIGKDMSFETHHSFSLRLFHAKKTLSLFLIQIRDLTRNKNNNKMELHLDIQGQMNWIYLLSTK